MSSSLLSASATSSSSASASASSSSTSEQPASFKVVGLILAVSSGVFIGTSFVIKKKGLLRSQAKSGKAAGEGVSYLKDWLWWIGMSLMILGEIFNFVAYAFVDAILVTPLGALAVVICAILSHFFLQEKLTLFGWIGCGLCILGSTIIALNSPEQAAVTEIRPFMKLFIAPGFLAWIGILTATALFLAFWAAPRYGNKNMFTHIGICSLIGGMSVSCTQGLGASILTSIRGNNQVTFWFFWFLLFFVAITLVTEVIFLNKALALFNTALVTPTYYVSFTFCTLVTSIILCQGLKATTSAIITIVLGFFVVCCGITILQLSKIDPTTLMDQPGIDRKSTLLLASQRPTEDQEKEITGQEEPGMDALRGGFGAVGSIIRARSRRASSINTNGSRHRVSASQASFDPRDPFSLNNMKRYTLTDEPTGHNDASAEGIGGGGPGARAGGGMRNGEPIGPNRSRYYAYEGGGTGEADRDIGVESRRMSKNKSGSGANVRSSRQPPPRSGTALTFQDQDTIHEYGRPGHPEDALHSTSYHPTQHLHPDPSSSSRQNPGATRSSSGSQNNPFIPPASTIRPVSPQNHSLQYPSAAGLAGRGGSFASSQGGGAEPVDERNQEERSFGTFAEKKGLYDYDPEADGVGDGYTRGHGYVDSVDSSRSVEAYNPRLPHAAPSLPYSNSSFDRRPLSNHSTVPFPNRSGSRDGPPSASMLSPTGGSRDRRDSSRSSQSGNHPSHRGGDYPTLAKKVEASPQHREERRGLVEDRGESDDEGQEDRDGKGSESGDDLDDLFIPTVKKR